MAKLKSYRHPVAGSTVITASGKVLVFGGKMGGPGIILTSDEDEQKLLDGIVATPNVPVQETAVTLDAVTGEAVATPDKAPDPSIAQSIADAAEASARAADPSVLAAQSNLAKLIAADTAASAAPQ